MIAVRLLDGRVGSTLLMQLLATSDEVVLERRYPEGELRYLSYCLRTANWVGTPWDPALHPGVTELFFGPPDLGGPIPFKPSLVDPSRLAPSILAAMWAEMSNELRRSTPGALYYAEKVAGDTQLLVRSDIPVRVIDLVRDPRDIFCSIRAFTKGGAGFGRDEHQSDDEFLDQMVANQLERLRCMAETPAGVERLLLRYEDLVVDLAGHASIIGDWLGLTLDHASVLAAREDRQHHMTSASPAGSIGRWRRELTTVQSRRVWEVLGAELDLLGYAHD